MFVNIIHFPPVKPGKDAEFREWFAWSNEKYTQYKGFIRRRLLKTLFLSSRMRSASSPAGGSIATMARICMRWFWTMSRMTPTCS